MSLRATLGKTENGLKTPEQHVLTFRNLFLSWLKNCKFGDKYLKHRTYVDNVSSVFPSLKEHYDGKYIELDFS